MRAQGSQVIWRQTEPLAHGHRGVVGCSNIREKDGDRGARGGMAANKASKGVTGKVRCLALSAAQLEGEGCVLVVLGNGRLQGFVHSLMPRKEISRSPPLVHLA